MSIARALCDGFVAELNQEWKGTAFYFWCELFTAPSTAPDELGILCQQTLYGKRRQCLRILFCGELVEIARVKHDATWEVVHKLELASPRCLDSLHHIIKRELSHV